MKYSRLIVAAVTCALVWGLAGTMLAADSRPPTDEDRCGVCGMFVAKYPNWVATVVFADGSQVFFDGPKDLFRYILNLEDFNAEDREISEVFVTDYYRTAFIDARNAFFVSGSDVMGPMGGELIPLEKREEAKTFAKDHGGREILEFDDITPDKIPR
jgi:nitrous oxide reductase accessory protein NosL